MSQDDIDKLQIHKLAEHISILKNEQAQFQNFKEQTQAQLPGTFTALGDTNWGVCEEVARAGAGEASEWWNRATFLFPKLYSYLAHLKRESPSVPMQATVPHGAVVGQSIQVLVNGLAMAVVVPPGVQPGGSITIQVPLAQVWEQFNLQTTFPNNLISLCKLYFEVVNDINTIIQNQARHIAHLETQLNTLMKKAGFVGTQNAKFGKKRYIGPKGGVYTMQYGRKKYLN